MQGIERRPLLELARHSILVVVIDEVGRAAVRHTFVGCELAVQGVRNLEVVAITPSSSTGPCKLVVRDRIERLGVGPPAIVRRERSRRNPEVGLERPAMAASARRKSRSISRRRRVGDRRCRSLDPRTERLRAGAHGRPDCSRQPSPVEAAVPRLVAERRLPNGLRRFRNRRSVEPVSIG